MKSSLTQVSGFRAIGVACGLKLSGNPDLALIVADRMCTTAAVFTTNQFKAAPVLYDQALLKETQGHLQGVIINAGNANAVTGEQGLRDAAEMARLTEMACNLPPQSVFVMCTGVIGHRLPLDKVTNGIQTAAKKIITPDGAQGHLAAQAIMTTDLVPKEAFLQTNIGGQMINIGGMCKGSGMIHPNMATMLALIVTDATIAPAPLDLALRTAVEVSFNAITVDGDTSTNDTLVILASGQLPDSPLNNTNSVEFRQFCHALTEVCISLAKAVARDGEGATKLVEITVNGALTQAEAKRAAKAIANSPLVKTALFGNDPNWGRVLAAVGYSGITVDPARTSLKLGHLPLVYLGEPLDFDAVAAHDWLAQQHEITLTVELGLGAATATVWTCDFSYKYVEINAEYHT